MRILTLLALAVGLVWVGPLSAAPCTDNYWQPTFVHDLDNEDGPYYVTGSGSFLPLRWQPDGGYVPHACELIRSPADLRDQRGFTNCYEYTRVQCGCSRAIPGNDTCAAFLAWHSAAAGTTGAPPPAMAPVAFSVPLTAAAWQQAPQYRAGIGTSNYGLVLQGGAWTNGRLQNGAYDGNRVWSIDVFDFSGGGDAYTGFAASGAGQYMGIWPRVLEGVSVHHMTTHHSWADSVVIPENTWIFAHVKVEPGGSYRIAVALGAYDDVGGQVIYANTGRLPALRARLELQFGDNYGGEATSLVIGEARVVLSGAGAAPSLPQARGQPGGAPCGGDTECASGLCLLGICSQ